MPFLYIHQRANLKRVSICVAKQQTNKNFESTQKRHSNKKQNFTSLTFQTTKTADNVEAFRKISFTIRTSVDKFISNHSEPLKQSDKNEFSKAVPFAKFQ